MKKQTHILDGLKMSIVLAHFLFWANYIFKSTVRVRNGYEKQKCCCKVIQVQNVHKMQLYTVLTYDTK